MNPKFLRGLYPKEPEAPLIKRVHFPEYAKKYFPPFTKDNRFKCLYGGRSSSKTTTVARILIMDAVQRPIRVAVLREYGSSTAQSVKTALEKAIKEMGLSDVFKVNKNDIYCKLTGSLFFFVGIVVHPDSSIRGLDDVDHCWIEEATFMTAKLARVLIPTIRKPGSQLWFTWNPDQRSDWIWKRFISTPSPRDVTTRVNYNDNPWFPEEEEEQRLFDKKYHPEFYANVWEGVPDDEGSTLKVLPYAVVDECIQAWTKYNDFVNEIKQDQSIPIELGLDVGASGGENDVNAITVRKGPLILESIRWRSKYTGNVARRAHVLAHEWEAKVIHYDVGGMGAGVQSTFVEMREQQDYVTRPENFGSAVKGADSRYSHRVTNGQHFQRRNAQLGFAVKLRATWTRMLLNGEDVHPRRCLFINPQIEELQEYTAQLSQPEWKENTSGRVEVDKNPEGTPSPDMYDATVLAFASDSRYGLKHPNMVRSGSSNVPDISKAVV